MGRKPNRDGNSPKVTFDLVKGAAMGRWVEIAQQVFRIPAHFLTEKHGPCPKCDGQDRWRVFDDFAQTGGAICNQCGRDLGDGFKLGDWYCGWKPTETLARVADYLGIAGQKIGGKPTKANPAEHLIFQPWNDALAAIWCLSKPPVTPAALKMCHARLARYRDQFTVIALPVWGEKLMAADPVGWCMYDVAGGTLPKFGKDRPTEYVKIKLTYGSKPGFIGPVDILDVAETAWKLEGPSDVLAFYSMDVDACNIALTNANGCGEKPEPWMRELLAAKQLHVLHDADRPGQAGASNWAPAKNVALPYKIEETHGKDLRDWINEGHGWDNLITLAAAADTLTLNENHKNEGPDNYHRLARLNLERYRKSTPNGTLRYWRNEWYKYTGNCYRKIDESELKAKVGQSVKVEYDRLAELDMINWDGEGEQPTVRNVTQALVSNVVFATAQMQILSGSVELNSWIGGRLQNSSDRRYVSLRNGVLDIDGLLKGEDDHLKTHSPDWFSVVCLPFDFDPNAECPTWMKFLHKNMEGDRERIAILQEWAGYLLLPNTDLQKFMFLEGEGANGKSVYLAAIEAMLGIDNCTHVQLEQFGQRFQLTQTLGKLANIASECSEMDSVAEGNLKAFASGDRMTFDRKGIPPIDASPTARLMVSANVRPRFADKSGGLWRRIIPMPWRVTIKESERVIGMDKVSWWERSGELPGIFNWAVAGFHKLMGQGRFTDSRVCRATLDDYRKEVNPAKVFFQENYIADPDCVVSTELIYDHYKQWCLDRGYRPASDRTFGRELHRMYPETSRRRASFVGENGKRGYIYVGIKPGNIEDESPENADHLDNSFALT